jgi:hypothetical protein
MPKILDFKVNWNENWDNAPSFVVVVDKSDNNFIFEEKDGIFLAVDGDFASFFFYKKPGQGYGGREFVLKMKDGNERILVGPWSSNSDAVNQRFPEILVREVNMDTVDGHHYAANMTHKAIIRECKARGIRVGIVKTYYGTWLQPLDKNGNPKYCRSGVEITEEDKEKTTVVEEF